MEVLETPTEPHEHGHKDGKDSDHIFEAMTPTAPPVHGGIYGKYGKGGDLESDHQTPTASPDQHVATELRSGLAGDPSALVLRQTMTWLRGCLLVQPAPDGAFTIDQLQTHATSFGLAKVFVGMFGILLDSMPDADTAFDNGGITAEQLFLAFPILQQPP